MAQPWSTPWPCAYTQRKLFWISKPLRLCSFVVSLRTFFLDIHQTAVVPCSTLLVFRAPLRITTSGGLLFFLGGCIATALRIKRLATSSSLPRVGCLIYLRLGRLFHVYKLRKKSYPVLFGDEDDDKIHDAEEEKDHNHKPRGLTNTITITTFS